MNVEYTGRGTTLNPRHKSLADTEITRIDGMLLGRIVSAHVILTEERYRQIAEVSLQLATETLVARCEGTDMSVQLHDALKKVEQQAIKHKERRMTAERQAKPNSVEPMIEIPPLPATAA